MKKTTTANKKLNEWVRKQQARGVAMPKISKALGLSYNGLYYLMLRRSMPSIRVAYAIERKAKIKMKEWVS